MTIIVTGAKQLKAKLKMLGAGMGDAILGGVILTANQVRTDAIKSIQNKSGGRQVQRSRQGGGTYTHTASATGGAPNTDTGTLVSSIAVEKVGDSTFHIGSNLDYSAFLEFGTSKMGARPWLQPAMQANSKNLISNIQKTVDIYIGQLA